MKDSDLDGETRAQTEGAEKERPERSGNSTEPAEPATFIHPINDVDSSGPRMHVLFWNHATVYAKLMEQTLESREIEVTGVGDLASAEEDWNLGLYDLLLVDHSVPLGARLTLLRTSAERHRAIPTVMIFEPDADQDAMLASKHGALACVFRDNRKEYLARVATLIENHAKQSNFANTQWLLSDGDSSDIDLEVLAAEVSGKAADVAPAYLTVLGGPDVGQTVQIDAALCVIGRDPTCQLCLTDRAISRIHASVKQLPGGITELKDLNSSNGVFLHGRRIAYAYLKGGDEILLGTNTLIKFQR